MGVANRAAAVLAVVVLTIVLPASSAAAFEPSGLLEIHTINVAQGSSVLVIGPDGTTVLLEAGRSGKGWTVARYLESLGLRPEDGLDYTIAGHMDGDHIGGLDDVVARGYDVRVANYNNGSRASTSGGQHAYTSAFARTTAGRPTAIGLGQVIRLGGGAKITVVAVGGEVLGRGRVWGADESENDLSVALLIQHGGFDYLWASDLGGGADDRRQTGRWTSQVNVETPIVESITSGGRRALMSEGGLDVLAVSHHGSESSTNSDLMNVLRPEVAIISVGAGQRSSFEHPRQAVVENVLLARARAISAPPALVLQTEEGSPIGRETSVAGFCAGDIAIKTDGRRRYTISATGRVGQGPDERRRAGLPRTISIDEASSTSTSGNRPPTVDAGSDQTVYDGDGDGAETVVLSGDASDPEGASVSLEWRAGSERLGNPARLITTLPIGTHRLSLTAEDVGGLAGSDSVTVSVRENRRPTARAGADQTVTDRGGDGAQRVTVTATASSDPDGRIAAYTWSEGSRVLGRTARLTTNLSVGRHQLTLTVEDEGGLTDQDTVVVRVVDNRPPVANAGHDRDSRDGNGDGVVTTTLDGSGSYDPDGSIVAWEWRDAWGRLLGRTERVRVTRGVGSTYTFTLKVTDDRGSYRTDRVAIRFVASP